MEKCKLELILQEKGKVEVIPTQPLLVFYQAHNKQCGYNEVVDNNSKDGWLSIKNIDDSYGLNVITTDEDDYEVYIPANHKCIITKGSNPNNFVIHYRHIEVETTFEEDEVEFWNNIFTIIEE